MSKTIKTKENTFYTIKTLTDDIGVMPVYADSYVGMSTTYDIKSNPDTSFYAVESTTVSPDDFIYGEGNINDIYLNVYVNSVTQSNPQTAPWLDVFMLKPNLDITEGNMVIVSGNYSAPVLLYNSYNDATSWVREDFDGVSKDFITAPIIMKGSIGVQMRPQLLIKRHQMMDIAFESDSAYKGNEYGWSYGSYIDNSIEEVGQGIDWIQFGLTKMGNTIVQGLGYYTDNEDDSRRNDLYEITKGEDGLYGFNYLSNGQYSVAYLGKGTDYYSNNVFAKPLMELRKPIAWWKERGAVESILPGGISWSDGSTGLYNQFEETFVSRCTQLNSIFSQVYSSPDVRDIKDQTLEGPGDTDRFIAYAYANLERAETPTDGACLRLKAFWENYSGSMTGTLAQNVANPFGESYYNNQPNPQSVVSTIYGIPQPTPLDITTSGTGIPAYAPEIEIVFKINNMPVTTFSTSGSDYVEGEGNYTLDRSFNIIWNDDAQSESEITDSTPSLTWASRMWRGMEGPDNADLVGGIYSSGTNFSPWISFIRTDPTSDSVDVICNANYWSNIKDSLVAGGINGIGLPSITPFKTHIPMGEWVTMRIKLNMYKTTCPIHTGPNTPTDYFFNASGGSSIVYFPGLYDTQGKTRSCLLAHGRPWGENSYVDGLGPEISLGAYSAQVYGNNAYYPNMNFWLNNMRAINEVGGGSSNHINAFYSKVDDIISDDKNIDVLIDSISFNQWGLNVNNGTICIENGMGQMTRLPSDTFVTPMVKQAEASQTNTTGTIAVNPTGSGSLTVDNYYAKAGALTASYMSFGFPEKTVIADEGTHAFLFNNYSAGVEETVLPITMVSGGYFTSGTYNGLFGTNYQNNWFNNLTVGDSTKNIHITGGAGSVDNFVQKGTVGVSGAFASWVKTGNPLVGAKIVSIADDNMSIIVDKPNVFDIPLNTPLAIEINNIEYKQLAKGIGSMGYYDSVGTANTTPLTQTKKRTGATIHLSRPVLNDDAGSTQAQFGAYNFDFNEQRNNRGQGVAWNVGIGSYAKYFNTNYNLSKATISPYQYWFNIAMLNVSSSAAWGDSFADVVQTATKVQATRAYDGIVAVSGGNVLGTTYNESLYNDGIYANKWSIDFVDPTASVVDLTTDYGFGSINSQSGDTIPDSDGGLGRVGRDFVVAGQNYINLGSYVYIAKPDMKQPFNFLVKPTYMSSFSSLYYANINTKDATTNPAQIIYGVKDPLPTVEDFMVSPIIDTKDITEPSKISSLTKAQSTDVLFKWKEGADDINYRMLWVDTSLIDNKYHKANFIAPNTSSSAGKYYISAANLISDDGTAMTGTYTTDIEGVCGWGRKTPGGEDQYAVGPLVLGSASEFTFTMQIKPSGGSDFSDNERAFFAASGNGYGGTYGTFLGTCHTDGKVKIRMNSGSATLTSTTSYAYNNKQPLAIVVTYDKNLLSNNFQLYINGRLEDTADYTSDFKGYTDQRVHIGVAASYHSFKGYLEEVTFHSKRAYIPQNSNTYTLSTNTLPDMTSDESNKYQSRLFLFDYHNVRGTSPSQVCRSNTTSWKVTGVT